VGRPHNFNPANSVELLVGAARGRRWSSRRRLGLRRLDLLLSRSLRRAYPVVVRISAEQGEADQENGYDAENNKSDA